MKLGFILSALAFVSGAALEPPPTDGNFFILQFGKKNSTMHMAELTIGGTTETIQAFDLQVSTR